MPYVATDPLATWLWLVDLPGWQRALHVGIDRGITTELAQRFAAVHHAGPAVAAGATPAHGARVVPPALPYRAASFDCVTAHDLLERMATSGEGAAAGAAAVIGECHRVLRPGGCLYLAVRNPYWYGRVTAGAGDAGGATMRPARVIRLLRAAGFRDIAAYYADPSHDRPLSLIPVDGRCVRAYERREEQRFLGSRRVLDALGFSRLLFKSQVLLACA